MQDFGTCSPDLIALEAQARQMRAQAIRASFKALSTWLRNHSPFGAQTA